MDLKELFMLMWNKLWIIILAILLVGGGVFSISKWVMTPIYSAKVSMYVNNAIRENNQTAVTQGDLTASQNLVDTYIVILESNAVLDKVAKQIGNISAREIRAGMSAAPINGTEAFAVTVNDPDPVRAREIANTVADVAPAEIIRVVKAGSVEVIDYAGLPSAPSSPNVLRNTAVGMLLGAVLAIGGILLVAMFDTTVHTDEDLKAAFAIPVIGVIPEITGVEQGTHNYQMSKGER